ncbi:hypothetical protein ROJ8625_01022 [Roseivivax jejudonensis]|uniref:Uncharacterized protein n=1 Tax=Roseivivax jejudonensis TaxID=1529041 RepID=A0A1X6YLY8_9RHOB|nr:PRC-barrel domain-containing protein [Roseivivax jejudonensis]SLN24681.1 hypothetical protein ROJ8625_01022 [Roseivivax jejudonensis]
MKLKALMMSAATAALLAGAATAQDDADGAVENSAEQAAEEAGDAAQEAGEAAQEAGEAAEQTAEDAADATADAAEDAGQAAENAGEEAAAEANEEMNEAEQAVEGETEEGDAAAEGEMEFTSIEEMTVGDVVGTPVFGPEDERIGEIDYVIDRGDGAEMVIGIGGFLGLGEYTVALPATDFQMSQEPQGFMLDTDQETLEQQPEYDESEIEPLPDDMMMSELMGGGDVEGGTSDMESGSTAGAAASGDTESESAGTDASGGDAASESGGMEDGASSDTESGADMESGDAEAETDTEEESSGN